MTQPAGDAVSVLRERIDRYELAWRRDHLPPPTRARPLPDPNAVKVARTLEECGRKLDRIGGQLRSRPVGTINDAALRSHLSFLIELTEQDDALADPDQFMASVRHLEVLAAEG